MIVKPSISFLNTDSDAMLIKRTHTILAAMTDNEYYLTPMPSLGAVTVALSDFTTAVANAAGGGVTLTSIKNDKREILVGLLRNLASYVQVTCNENMTALLSSGFPPQKPQRTPIGIPATPSISYVRLGTLTGELDAAISPVFGASTYNWQIYDVSAPTIMVQTAQTTAASKTFTNLIPGKIYAVQANAVGSAGISDWSNPISQMVV